MEKEFVPYDIALAMKELGFKKKCFKFYWADEVLYAGVGEFKNKETDLSDEKVSAPLYQQCFRWFREKHLLHAMLDCSMSEGRGGVNKKYNFWYKIHMNKVGYRWIQHTTIKNDDGTKSYIVRTYEEAQDACLRKLIKIVKEKQDRHN